MKFFGWPFPSLSTKSYLKEENVQCSTINSQGKRTLADRPSYHTIEHGSLRIAY
jgi:hypothetical protein